MPAQPCQQPIIESVRDALHRYDAELKDINLKVWLSVQDRWLHRSPTQIWSDPELAYEEHRAHANICALFDTLSAHGYQVRRKIYGVDTAFEIEYSHGTGGRVVAFNAEYDALPGIGHACGHNLIATSSISAFIATCEALKARFPDGPAYTVRLLGTPAEESGGGKVRMLDAGAYKDVDACLMVHPMPKSANNPELLSMATVLPGGFLANDKVRVTFTGKPAHAAAAPWEGVNALDAVVSAYVNISVLRQQILPSQRVHGVIVQGGDRPNIIPQSATVDYYIRSEDAKSLKPLTDRVVKCFEAAAIATGCEVEFNWYV
jgi:amidohydrolase